MKDVRALVLAAHGSRWPDSNREVGMLAERLAAVLGDTFAHTAFGFLELAQPSISECIDQVIAKGATRVAVLPYFLVAGRHVSLDIPDIVAAKRNQYPGVRIDLIEYLGAHTGIVDLLHDAAQKA